MHALMYCASYYCVLYFKCMQYQVNDDLEISIRPRPVIAVFIGITSR